MKDLLEELLNQIAGRGLSFNSTRELAGYLAKEIKERPEVMQYLFERLADLTDEEIQQLWYRIVDARP